MAQQQNYPTGSTAVLQVRGANGDPQYNVYHPISRVVLKGFTNEADAVAFANSMWAAHEKSEALRKQQERERERERSGPELDM